MRGAFALLFLAAALAPGPALAVSGRDAVQAHGRVFAPHPRSQGHAAPQVILPYGYVAETLAPDAAEAAPAASPTTIVVQPAPLVQTAEHPPCRETTPEGVVVQRGGGCSHAAQ